MFISLVAITYIILFFIYYKNFCIRTSIIFSSITWGLIVTIITEVLSFFKIITPIFVELSWILVVIVSIIAYFRAKSGLKDNLELNEEKTGIALKFILGFVFIIVSIILFSAIIFPPNTHDSMTYHMARIMHWIQNQSVAHYPTNDIRQLYSNPWSEYALMHFQILSGGDYFANLLQWFSMIGSLISTSLITMYLGGNKRAQLFTVAITATIPMGILQGSSTQNDYITAFWLSCFVCLVFKYAKSKNVQMSALEIIMTGASLGLAILTKGTAYSFALPFVLYLVFLLIKRLQISAWKPLTALGIIVLSINMHQYIRNIEVFNTPLVPEKHKKIVYNEANSAGLFFSSIIKHSFSNINTLDLNLNDSITHFLYNLHNKMHININDERTTFPGQGFMILGAGANEDTAGNTIHLLMIWGSILAIFFISKNKSNHLLKRYMLLCVSSFVLFSALVKWQPWITRYHLVFFVLSSAFLGIIIEKIRSKKAQEFIIFVLIIATIPYLLLNNTKNLFFQLKYHPTRLENYFVVDPIVTAKYFDIANQIKASKCSNIGLIMNEDQYEYPLWVLLNDDNSEKIRIEHIAIKNESAIFYKKPPFSTFAPCITLDITNLQLKK